MNSAYKRSKRDRPNLHKLRTLDVTESQAHALDCALRFLEDPREVLEECNRILDGYGIEHVTVPEGTAHPDLSADYVNLGDTYTDTILFDTEARAFRVESWGHWFEGAEEDYAEESGEARCGYCGEWSESDTRSACCPSFHLCGACGRCSACGTKPAKDSTL